MRITCSSFAAAALTLFALQSCGPIPLTASILLDSTSPNIDDCMQAIDLATLDSSCPGGGGMKLRPGMVLHISTLTWGPGLGPAKLPPTQVALDHVGKNLEVDRGLGAEQPQIAAPLRLPIRHVGPSQSLTTAEVLVLGAVLSLHRFQNFGAPKNANDVDIKNIASKWSDLLKDEANRAILWNALIDSTHLRRVAAANSGHAVLSLVTVPGQFCDAIQANMAADAAALVRVGVFDPQCSEAAGSRTGIETFSLRIDAQYDDPLTAVVAPMRNKKLSPDFFSDILMFNPIDVVTADLNGVTIAGEGDEVLWTLAEWESSGVCAPRRIDSFSVQGSSVVFHVVRDKTHKVTYHVFEHITPESATHALKPLNPSDTLLNFLNPTIAESDLARLRARDVRNLTWTGAGPPGIADPCTK